MTAASSQIAKPLWVARFGLKPQLMKRKKRRPVCIQDQDVYLRQLTASYKFTDSAPPICRLESIINLAVEETRDESL